MSYKDKYINLTTAYGADIQSTFVSSSKQKYSDVFYTSPSFTRVSINSSSVLFGVQITDSSDVKDEKRIVTLDYQLQNGDIIDWQSSKWINILTDNMADIYHRGTLRRCVGQLKWVDDEGIIRSSYFTFKSDPATNFGVQDGRILTIGNERRNLIVKLDEHTAKFKKGVRFIFDNRVWTITAIDTISVSGLSIITVDEGMIDEAKDNLELGIADYFGRVATYAVRILNGQDVALQIGSTLSLNIEVIDEILNSVINKDIVFQSTNPDIVSVGSDGLLIAHAQGESSILIRLADDPSVNSVLTVRVNSSMHPHPAYAVELVEEPYVRKGFSKNFNIVFKDNGVIDTATELQFYLHSNDKLTVTHLAEISSFNTRTVTIKGLDYGDVALRVYVVGQETELWLNINIKGLI